MSTAHASLVVSNRFGRDSWHVKHRVLVRKERPPHPLGGWQIHIVMRSLLPASVPPRAASSRWALLAALVLLQRLPLFRWRRTCWYPPSSSDES